MKEDKKGIYLSNGCIYAALFAISAVVTAIDCVRVGFIPEKWSDLWHVAFEFGGTFIMMAFLGYIGSFAYDRFNPYNEQPRKAKIKFWVIYLAVLFFICFMAIYWFGGY